MIAKVTCPVIKLPIGQKDVFGNTVYFKSNSSVHTEVRIPRSGI